MLPREPEACCGPSCGTCKRCRDGVCVPISDGTDCGDCKECESGSCESVCSSELCQTCEDEIWVMSGLARSYIALGNDPNAQKVIDALLVQFSESEFIANELCGIAESYCDAGQYEKALELYQYILQTRQDCRSQDVILAMAGIISANIGLDNHSTAETEIDELIAEFSNHPDFPETVSRIEEDYFDKVFLVKGLAEKDWLRPIWMWEKVLSADANFFYNDPDLYYFIASCYYKIGEYGNALEYFEFTSINWPDKKIGRDAQIMLDKVEQKLIMLAK